MIMFSHPKRVLLVNMNMLYSSLLLLYSDVKPTQLSSTQPTQILVLGVSYVHSHNMAKPAELFFFNHLYSIFLYIHCFPDNLITDSLHQTFSRNPSSKPITSPSFSSSKSRFRIHVEQCYEK